MPLCGFPDRVFLKHESKMTVDWSVVKFLRCSVGPSHSMRMPRLSLQSYIYIASSELMIDITMETKQKAARFDDDV